MLRSLNMAASTFTSLSWRDYQLQNWISTSLDNGLYIIFKGPYIFMVITLGLCPERP